MGILGDDTLWGWGNNGYYELGLGDQIDREEPVIVDISSWKYISCSGSHSLGIKLDNTLW
jgi:alpha-tubulin suppressor-like RCC1 family protein